jgi:branched-chain amino acid transport system permease protein
MGINTKRMYIYAMCLAIVVILSSTFVLFHFSGGQYLLIAFGVVVIGGMGSIIGTLAGGIILGLAQLLGGHFFGFNYQLHSGFVALLIVLTLRPRGLFSKAIRK